VQVSLLTNPGNVVISANLACLQVSTSSLKMGRGGNTGSNALITQSSQTLVIDISPIVFIQITLLMLTTVFQFLMVNYLAIQTINLWLD
jgi:hypothetical protein